MGVLKILGWAAAGAAVLAAAGAATLAVQARTVGVPPGLGVADGRLAPCPDSPNCVSSQADPGDRVHYMPPVPLGAPAAEAQASLRELLAAQPRVELLRDEPGYLHAVFRSATFGFPDDVEFYLDEAAGLIHFRSAARLGQGDMGVNRARMERLSAELAAALAG
ncbi:MAG TPA: DUF1499 domain-containing protein [Chloroflexaceae bacterium]|nr:DUF1499 domain-containing protein [Chloroflexaceae bacterium]